MKGEKEGKKEKGKGFLSEFWKLLKGGKAFIAIMLFLDASFILALVLFRKIVGYFAPSVDPSRLPSIGDPLIWYLLVLFAIYYLLVLLLYSLIKFLALHFTKSLFVKASLDFGRFPRFYGLNVALLGMFGVLFFGFAYLISAVKQPYAITVLLLLGIPLVLLFFIVLNAAHSIFHAKGLGIFRTMREAFSFEFTKVKSYGKVIAVSIAIIGGSLLLLYLMGLLIRLLAEQNYALYYSLYQAFKSLTEIVGFIVIYAIVLINRVAFYAIIRKGEEDNDLSQP